MNEDYFKAVTIPAVTHLAPPEKLKFILGATSGFEAVNGYFYHVEFKYDDTAFIGTEA